MSPIIHAKGIILQVSTPHPHPHTTTINRHGNTTLQVVHRDSKPQDMCRDATLWPKIVDFRMSATKNKCKPALSAYRPADFAYQ